MSDRHGHDKELLNNFDLTSLVFHINYDHPELQLPQSSTPTLQRMREAHKNEHLKDPETIRHGDYTDISGPYEHTHKETELYEEGSVTDHLCKAHDVVYYESHSPDAYNAQEFHRTLHPEGFTPREPLFTEDMVSEARKPGAGKVTINKGLLNPKDQVGYPDEDYDAYSEREQEIPTAVRLLQLETKHVTEVVTQLLNRLVPVTGPLKPSAMAEPNDPQGPETTLGQELHNVRGDLSYLRTRVQEILDSLEI